MSEMLRAVYKYRYFVLSSIRNDLRLRFARSKLGGLWMIIHPLAQVLIFALILSELLAAKLPGIESKYAYALYLMSGSLCWTLFSEVIMRSLTLFIDNGELMKKIAFPRVCLPLIAGGGALINNVLLLAAIFAVFAVLGHYPDHHVLWLPVLMGLTLFMCMGLGLLLGILNVFMRDIGQTVPVILQILFWLTPIVYSIEILPVRYHQWFRLNPLYPLVSSYQKVLVYGESPQWGALAWLALMSVVTWLVALLVFRRSSAEMVDAL